MARSRIPAIIRFLGGMPWYLASGDVAETVQADEAPVSLEKATLVFVGSYTSGESRGIYSFRLRTSGNEVSQNITLVPLGLAAETLNPTYLELDAKGRRVFAVNETDTFQGLAGGAVSSFSVDQSTGKLALLNQRLSGGAGPCHCALDREGKNLLVANGKGGSVSVLPVDGSGRLGVATAVVEHKEKGRPQCVTTDAANRFVFVCDGALDAVFVYPYDAATGKLAAPSRTGVKAGSAPRRLVFRPDGRFAYVVNERSSTITTFSYAASEGRLSEIETVSTLPPYFDGKNTAAEMGMHPSGKWLYVSNRGNESVVLFEINRETGALNYIEEQGTGGKTPRHFGIQPSAAHLAICNQDSNTVLVCRIDSGNGRLKPSGVFASAPAPTCAQFLPPPGGAQ